MTMYPRDRCADEIAACARGDRAALKAIYEREGPFLIAVATRILRRRDLAEEAVQDGFVRIWKGAAGFDPKAGSGRGWITAIVRNRALNLLRDDRHMPVEDSELEILADDAPAEDAFERLAETSSLRACLARLDPKRRACVLLAYVSGLTHGEIAARLGVPLGTAKAWVRRSLLSLRECMA